MDMDMRMGMMTGMIVIYSDMISATWCRGVSFWDCFFYWDQFYTWGVGNEARACSPYFGRSKQCAKSDQVNVPAKKKKTINRARTNHFNGKMT